MGTSLHTFHIPVLGIGFSVDTPIKVAKYGISSVISIMDDELIEKLRMHYSLLAGIPYSPIPEKDIDHRALRITSYLNIAQIIVEQQIKEMKALSFDAPNDLVKYFELLPDNSPLKQRYFEMQKLPTGNEKAQLQQLLKDAIIAGSIDVNIMTKLDRTVYLKDGTALPPEYSDASAALRGFAKSDLSSSLVLSAGYSARLFSYLEEFSDFFPDISGFLKKKIILKVSDYRSALVQGKVLAKKGLWVSEYRVESGLNCGGHAFPTDGYLLGPILEEFKQNRNQLKTELLELCNTANTAKGNPIFKEAPEMKVTAQGGIGTASEQEFLLQHYGLDCTGWGSPFLLVPEATNMDEPTLQQLSEAKKEDYYLSYASPLGVAFNNFKPSSSQKLLKERVDKNRPGSPCYKKLLVSNTEFTDIPICTSSREYQNLKIKQLDEQGLSKEAYEIALNRITEKECLCEGLGSSVLIKNELPLNHKLSAVSVCPGPNLAYFSGIFSLNEMVGHIYGRLNLNNALPRPNLFINELNLYLSHYKRKIDEIFQLDAKQEKYLQNFKTNLMNGISYYESLVKAFDKKADSIFSGMKEELDKVVAQIQLASFKLQPAE